MPGRLKESGKTKDGRELHGWEVKVETTIVPVNSCIGKFYTMIMVK